MEDDFVGAIKIKDGLFIGDEYAAQDFEFVVTNKVTHIINCAGKQIPNYWETVGVIYLTFDWLDSETQTVFDTKGEVVNEIFNFIEDAAKLGEGVLVHSIKGQSRSCCVLTAYFMKRYRWSLYKTLEFLTSRRSDLEIRTSFYHQLLNLESRLFQQADGNVTVNWFEMGPQNDREEILLRNTFLNARSAPFDEALVNPQAGVDTKPRTINWGDERPSSKGGLALYFNKEMLAAKKPTLTSCKSILKGSNKVFKLKAKFAEEEPPSASSKGNTSAGLRTNKSVRNFSEGRNGSDAVVDDAVVAKVNVEKVNAATEKNQGMKGPNMMRSSSATYLEREDNTRTAAGKGQTTDKSNNAKVSNVNGNIIHLTVNNYLGPVNNQTNTALTNNFTADNESKQQKQGVAPKTPEPRPASQQKSALEAKKEEEANKQVEPSSATSVTANGQTSAKGSLSTNYLKSAIEKKLSKEYKSQLSSTALKGDIQPVTVKTPNGTESKGAKAFKEYAKPSDLKVNYQVLLKNRETPPPRKREEAKRGLDSPNKRAASKSSISTTKGGNDSNMPYSSYLNSMFSTSFTQLNTVTPSAYATAGEKKTPISAKAAMSYNLTLSQKAQTLTRPQRSTTGQIGDKNYGSSMLGSSINKSKIEPASATLMGTKFNNYTSSTQSKGNPVRVTYEKIERPHSATPDRSATPQAGQRRPGTSTSTGFGSKTDQRFSVPSKNTKHNKKDSSTQELLAKHRQRSSSPSPMGYNPALSNSSMSLKSKAKY